MELLPNYSILLPSIFASGHSLRIILVGCGGTGSYIVPALCQYVASTPRIKKAKIIFIDGDIVEEKNLVRQKFIASDLGKNKAEVLAERYSAAYGLDILSIPSYLDMSMPFIYDEVFASNHDLPTIIIGAVDNHNARLQIAGLAYRLGGPTICIDTGNSMWNGQVHVYACHNYWDLRIGRLSEVSAGATAYDPEYRDFKVPFLFIPPPMFRDFSLTEKTITDVLVTGTCEENAAVNTQTINANMMSAQCAITYLYQILDRTINTFTLYFDAKTGTVRSVPITEQTYSDLFHEWETRRADFDRFLLETKDNLLAASYAGLHSILAWKTRHLSFFKEKK